MFDFTAMMTTKLVLLKLLSCGRRFPQKSTETVNAIGKAVVVLKLEGDEVSIENSPLVAVSSHQAWTTFQVNLTLVQFSEQWHYIFITLLVYAHAGSL
jgi:hypothetical protein